MEFPPQTQNKAGKQSSWLVSFILITCFSFTCAIDPSYRNDNFTLERQLFLHAIKLRRKVLTFHFSNSFSFISLWSFRSIIFFVLLKFFFIFYFIYLFFCWWPSHCLNIIYFPWVTSGLRITGQNMPNMIISLNPVRNIIVWVSILISALSSIISNIYSMLLFDFNYMYIRLFWNHWYSFHCSCVFI